MTPRSSRSAPVADPAVAPAAPARRTASRGLAGDAAAYRPGSRRAASPPRPQPGARGRGRRRRDLRQPSRARRPRPSDRSPLAGLSPGDWLGALQTGARSGLRRRAGSRSSPRFLAFLRRRLTGDYEVDEYGFDPEVAERLLLAALRPLAQKWFRIEMRGVENLPAEGGALVVSNHSGTLPVDGLMTMVTIHDQTGRFLRPLGADLVFRMPLVSSLARKGGATLACNEDAERMLRRRRAGRRLARGLQGHRQAVPRALQAAALRSRRLRVGGAAHRRTDRAAVGGRRRGDLPADRQRPVAGAAARHPLRPDHAAVPVARARWAWSRCRRSGCIEFGEPIRTDELRRRARPTTRCWSSTSPTRCARPSSSRSTPCWGSASRSGAEPRSRPGEDRQRGAGSAGPTGRLRRQRTGRCCRAVLPTVPARVLPTSPTASSRFPAVSVTVEPEVGLLVVGQPAGEVLHGVLDVVHGGPERSGAV